VPALASQWWGVSSLANRSTATRKCWTAANNRANNRANTLVYGGVDDWRQPTSFNAAGTGLCGPAFNCSGSEMGHMFFNEFGATAGQSILAGSHAANLALFTNLKFDYHWSGAERRRCSRHPH